MSVLPEAERTPLDTAVFHLQMKTTSEPAIEDYLTEAHLFLEYAFRLEEVRNRGWRRGSFICIRDRRDFLSIARRRTFVPRSKDWGRRI